MPDNFPTNDAASEMEAKVTARAAEIEAKAAAKKQPDKTDAPLDKNFGIRCYN